MPIKRIAGAVFRFAVNAVIMLFSLSCIFPLLWLLNSSLKTDGAFLQDSLSLAVAPYIQNYRDAMLGGKLMQAFGNSLFLSLGNVAVTVIFAVMLGYFFARYDFRLKKLIYALFVSGMVIPVLSLLIPVFIQFNVLGILDHRCTLLIPYVAFSMPLSVILADNYMHSIPVEMDEAAYLEGCSTGQMLTRIIFPMCLPVISILVITSFMYAWNEFPFALVLVRSESLRTISIAIRLFNSEHSVKYTLHMAALVITIIPIFLIYLGFSKQIMESMVVGAVKG